jgi:hypothetical protein|tara:strand:+ start:1272 stop:1517 length:246 start_codon:yes stop_codon:yes gene_type:complete
MMNENKRRRKNSQRRDVGGEVDINDGDAAAYALGGEEGGDFFPNPPRPAVLREAKYGVRPPPRGLLFQKQIAQRDLIILFI